MILWSMMYVCDKNNYNRLSFFLVKSTWEAIFGMVWTILIMKNKLLKQIRSFLTWYYLAPESSREDTGQLRSVTKQDFSDWLDYNRP